MMRRGEAARDVLDKRCAKGEITKKGIRQDKKRIWKLISLSGKKGLFGPFFDKPSR